ncbi:MAG: ATP-binding protein [Armatimonadota bacterium]
MSALEMTGGAEAGPVDCGTLQRELLRAATDGRLELLPPDAEPEGGRLIAELQVRDTQGYAAARVAIAQAAELAGMPPEGTTDLLLATGEAISNAMKYGGGAECLVFLREGRVVVRVRDRGPGIPTLDLPAAVLLPGFSTAISLGLGYEMMLKLVDCVRLRTGPDGTLVQLEKWVGEPEAPPREPDYSLATAAA